MTRGKDGSYFHISPIRNVCQETFSLYDFFIAIWGHGQKMFYTIDPHFAELRCLMFVFAASAPGAVLFAVLCVLSFTEQLLCDTGYGTDCDCDLSLREADCDDHNDAIYPGAEEICNNVDDDCDSETDEGFETTNYYLDADVDGYGTLENFLGATCWQPYDGTPNLGDCDDADASVYYGAPETCDGLDNDCDGFVDQIDTDHDNYPDYDVRMAWYYDADGDGFGAETEQYPHIMACAGTWPEGYNYSGGDCDDNDPNIYYGCP
jgi:hypothetical protein